MYSEQMQTTECVRMRKLFDRKITSLCNNRKLLCYKWQTREWILNTINYLESFDPRLPWTSESGQMERSRFIVGEKNGVKILKIKEDSNGVTSRQITAIEDYFEILYEAHLKTGHGSRVKMMEYIEKKNVYVPTTAVLWFVKYCKVCRASKLAPTKKYVRSTVRAKDYHGFVELINMSDTPDGFYNYILHYRDISSNYMFLKPMRTPQVTEICDVLLKLFLEIGCPAILHTPISESFTKSIIQLLSLMLPGRLILIGNKMKAMKKIDKIEDNIREWMNDNQSNNWSKGIYFVANTKNLERIETKPVKCNTPYKDFIGKNPKQGLDTHGFKSVLNLKYEDDLEKIINLGEADYHSDESDQTVEKYDEVPNLDSQNSEIKTRLKERHERRNEYIEIFDQHFREPKRKDNTKSVSTLTVQESAKVNKSGSKAKPIRMYTRKPKPVVASTSQTEDSDINLLKSVTDIVDEEKELNSLNKGKIVTYSKKSIKKDTPKNDTKIIINKHEVKQSKPMCIGRNPRDVTEYADKSKLKVIEMWNTSEIDLPVPSNTDSLSLKTSLELTNSDEHSFDKLYFTENYSLDPTKAISKEVRSLEKIAMVKSLRNSNNNKKNRSNLVKINQFPKPVNLQEYSTKTKNNTGCSIAKNKVKVNLVQSSVSNKSLDLDIAKKSIKSYIDSDTSILPTNSKMISNANIPSIKQKPNASTKSLGSNKYLQEPKNLPQITNPSFETVYIKTEVVYEDNDNVNKFDRGASETIDESKDNTFGNIVKIESLSSNNLKNTNDTEQVPGNKLTESTNNKSVIRKKNICDSNNEKEYNKLNPIKRMKKKCIQIKKHTVKERKEKN